jgi:hypothetical protein
MKQLQFDADVLPNRTLSASRTPHTASQNDTLQPRIVSLLLGLTMRDWLCDADKEFLDDLVCDPELVFLIKQGVCLHPEGAQFIPVEQIESSHRMAGNAVFAQRHTISRGHEHTTLRIRSANVGHIAGPELILGVLGRLHREDQSLADHRFESLVEAFRRAQNSLESLVASLNPVVPQGQPALFVNRCSGRIIGLNASAHETLDIPEEEVIGLEYGRAREFLASTLADKILKIKNVSHDGLELAVIMILSEPEPEPAVPAIASAPTIGFIQTIRNKVSSISSAALHLETILGNNPGNSVSELIQIIREETADLDRHAWRQELITRYDQLPGVETNPVAELKSAIDLVSAFRNKCRIMLFEDAIDGCRFLCPRSSMLLLFESVLRSHLTANHDQIESRITVRCAKSDGNIAVIFQTKHHDSNGELAFHPDWLDYLHHLAAAMSLKVTHAVDAAANTLKTQVSTK